MNNKKEFFSVQMLVEAGIMLAIAVVLDQIPGYKMPQGGSVGLKTIPLVIFAIRWGALRGFFVGAVFGILNMLLGGSIYYPVQAILDYPLAFAFIGLSGLRTGDEDNLSSYIPGILLGFVLKYFTSVVSGVIFFSDSLPENVNPWVNSLVYNSYMAVELALAIIVLVILWKPLMSVAKKDR